MKLNFRKTGNGHPIIILHGLYGSSDNWFTIARKLENNYTIYLPDARNHGRSPHNTVHTYEAMRDDLKEFIDSHKIKNPILIGHSMGGKRSERSRSVYDTQANYSGHAERRPFKTIEKNRC